MGKRVVVISPAGQRLMIRVAEGVLESAPAADDDDTHLQVEPGQTSAQAQPTVSSQNKGKVPRPPWDITMSLVSGLPEGLDQWALERATRVEGPLSLADLVSHLHDLPEDGQKVLILGDNRAS